MYLTESGISYNKVLEEILIKENLEKNVLWELGSTEVLLDLVEKENRVHFYQNLHTKVGLKMEIS